MTESQQPPSLFATVSRKGSDIVVMPNTGGEHTIPDFLALIKSNGTDGGLSDLLKGIKLPEPNPYLVYPDSPTEVDILYTHVRGRFVLVNGGSPPRSFGLAFRVGADDKIADPDGAMAVLSYMVIPTLFPEISEPSSQVDDDFGNEPLGPACSREDGPCESCQ